MLIGINGYSGSGKDTVGIIIQYLKCTSKENVSIEEAIKNYKDHEWWLEEKSEWEIKKFAGKLKDIASHLTGYDIEDFEDQEFKKTLLGSEWGMTVREFLQKLGTDALRTGLHDDVWVNALMADYKPIEYGDDEQPHLPNWIITDCRFPNEAQVIKDKGGIIIRIDRPEVSAINNHSSEVGLDNWKFDYKIANVSGIFELKEYIENILKHEKLL
jgi:hypothetical protein